MQGRGTNDIRVHDYLLHGMCAPRNEKVQSVLEVVVKVWKIASQSAYCNVIDKITFTVGIGIVLVSILVYRMNGHTFVFFIMYS